MAKVTKPFKEKKEKKSKSEKKQVEERGDKTGARKAVEGVPEQPPGVPWTVGPWKGCASPDEIEKADELMIARLKRGWSERPDPRTISSTAASSSGSARPLEEDDDRTETEAPQQEVKPKAIKAKAKARARWTTGSLQPEAVDAAESQQEAVDAAVTARCQAAHATGVLGRLLTRLPRHRCTAQGASSRCAADARPQRSAAQA